MPADLWVGILSGLAIGVPLAVIALQQPAATPARFRVVVREVGTSDSPLADVPTATSHREEWGW